MSLKRKRISVRDKFLKDFPSIFEQFDFERNELTREEAGKIPAGRNKPNYFWKCSKYSCDFKCEHVWEAPVHDRTRNLSECRFCTKFNVLVCKHNSVAYLFPNLLSQFDPLLNPGKDLFKISLNSNLTINWTCSNFNCDSKCSHIWSARVIERTQKNNGCPFCSGREVCEHNSIYHKRPDLMEDWSPNNTHNPKKLSLYSHEKCLWYCKKCNYEWKSMVYNRTRGSRGCLCSSGYSKGERQIADILCKLSEKKIPFEFTFKGQQTFPDLLNDAGTHCLRYDFGITSPLLKKNSLIEYDHEQHFGPIKGVFNKNKDPVDAWIDRVKIDLKKNLYAKKNGLHLMRIHYKFPEKQREQLIVDYLLECLKQEKLKLPCHKVSNGDLYNKQREDSIKYVVQ